MFSKHQRVGQPKAANFRTRGSLLAASPETLSHCTPDFVLCARDRNQLRSSRGTARDNKQRRRERTFKESVHSRNTHTRRSNMASKTHVMLPGSKRGKDLSAVKVADIDPKEKVVVTIGLQGPKLPGPDQYIGKTLTPAE